VLETRVRITEGDRRLIGGDVGYVTDAGFTTEARWTHRNFYGGGRALTLTGIAQTGWLALVEDPDIRYRLALSLKQPAFGHRHVSAVIGPFVEHRDDSQDLSTQVGLNTTLVYQRRTLNSLSLDYQVAKRRVDQYRFNDLASGDVDLFTFLVHISQGLVDSLGSSLNSSLVTLSGTYGILDDPANPRQGVIVRPAVQVTAPTSISSTAYWRADLTSNGYLPLGRSVVIASRFKIGQLFPFGKSVPDAGEDPRAKFLQLHDVAFSAGGTGDVRGWEKSAPGPQGSRRALRDRRRFTGGAHRGLRSVRWLRAHDVLVRGAPPASEARAELWIAVVPRRGKGVDRR
jgi:outer membrane protein assembly factor BamA